MRKNSAIIGQIKPLLGGPAEQFGILLVDCETPWAHLAPSCPPRCGTMAHGPVPRCSLHLNCYISKAAGGATEWHESTKPASWRGGLRFLEPNFTRITKNGRTLARRRRGAKKRTVSRQDTNKKRYFREKVMISGKRPKRPKRAW